MTRDGMNLGEIKLHLLLEGVRFENKVLLKHYNYLSKRYYYGKSDQAFDNTRRPPQEIMLGNGLVVVGVTQRQSSPWIVKEKEDDKFYLYKNDDPITNVYIHKVPAFYNKKINNSITANEVLSIYGGYILAAFVRGTCDFFSSGLECHFCSLNPTREEVCDGLMTLKGNLIKQAAELAFKYDNDRISSIMFCGGSYFNHNEEIRNYIECVKAINLANINKNIHQHVLAAPPTDFDLYYELKESGIDSVGISLEVYNPDIFNKICPGKSQNIGYEHFFKAYEKAVQVFGKGRVYSVLVGGLEPLDSIKEGINLLTKMGVVPSINVFHPNPKSKLENMNPPSFEYIYDLTRYLGKLYRYYDYVPAVCGFNRNSLDAEGASGFFEENFQYDKIILGRNPGRQVERNSNKNWEYFSPNSKIFI